MSTELDPVVFEVTALIEQAIANLAEVKTAITETAGAVAEESAKMKESSGEATAGFKEMAEAMGAFAAFDFLKESVQVAAAGAAANSVLAQSIKNTGASYEEMEPHIESVDAQMRAFGFTNDQTNQSLAVMTQITGNAAKAQNLMGLAADLAAAKHIDLATATKAVGMAEQGHVTLLTRMGIQTKDAAGHTLTAAQAIQAMTDKFKGAASAYASSMGGQMQVMKAQLDDAKEKIGNALIPAIIKLMPIFIQLANIIANNVIPPLVALGNIYNKHKELINTVGIMVITVIAAYKSWIMVTKAVELAQVALDAVLDANPLGAVLLAVTALVGGFLYLWNTCKPFRQFMIQMWNDIERATGNVVSEIIKYLKSLVDLWLHTMQTLLDSADSILGKFVPGLDSARQAVDSFVSDTDATMQGWANSAAQWGSQVVGSINQVKAALNSVSPGSGGPQTNISSGFSVGVPSMPNSGPVGGGGGGGGGGSSSAKDAASAAAKHHAEQLKKHKEALKKHREAIAEHNKKVLEEEKKQQAALAKQQDQANKDSSNQLQQQLDDTQRQLQAARDQIAATLAQGNSGLQLVNGQIANVGTSLLNLGHASSPVNVTVNVAGSVTTQQQLITAVHQGLLTRQRTNSSLGFAV